MKIDPNLHEGKVPKNHKHKWELGQVFDYQGQAVWVCLCGAARFRMLVYKYKED